MNDPTKQQQDGMLKCEVCLKEVPISSAVNDEATDYVIHFCGLECYGKWKQQSDNQEPED